MPSSKHGVSVNALVAAAKKPCRMRTYIDMYIYKCIHTYIYIHLHL